MKVKSFKWYLKEEEDKSNFNAFVESVFQHKWDYASKNFGYFTDKYHCKDEEEIKRIIFFPKQQIDSLGGKKSNIKKMLIGFLTQENQGHPRFFTKDDIHNIKNHLEYLSSIGEQVHGYTPDKDNQGNITNNPEGDYIGLIFSQKTGSNDNVDFSFYKNGNSQIKERIDKTKPVLAINSTSIRLEKQFKFDDNGWSIADFEDDDLADYTQNEEEPESEDTEVPEEEEETKNETK